MKLLIDCGADLEDKTNNGFTLLGYTISASENLKEFCKLKVSLTNLDNQGNSAFHLAIANKIPPKKIKEILTNARFDSKEIDDEELNRQLKETAMATLLVLKEFYIPKDPQFSVLDKLTSKHDIQGFNQKLSQFLSHKSHTNNLITQAKKRNNKFKQIAKIKNQSGESALDLLNSLLADPDQTIQQYAQSIQPLLTGEQYNNDIAEFIQQKGNVPKDNLVLAHLYN